MICKTCWHCCFT